MNFFEELKNFDSEVADACDKELQRQRYKRWYAQNSEKKKEYTKNYYRKYLSREARENNCN